MRKIDTIIKKDIRHSSSDYQKNVDSYLDCKVDRNGLATIKNHKNFIKKALKQDYFEDSISLWVSEMDFPIAIEIIKAINDRVSKNVLGYTAVNSTFYKSIIDWLSKRHRINVEKKWLLFSPGTMMALRNAIRSLTNENDGIIIQPPVYAEFGEIIESTGRKIISNYLIYEDGEYSIDFDDFAEKASNPNTTMFIICNPHNPIGEVWSKENLERLVRISNENNLVIFSDEIHDDLVRQTTTFESILNIEESDKVIVATSLSKTFNLTGLNATNLIIKNKAIRNTFENYTGYSGITPIVLEATIAAYTQSEYWLDLVIKRIDYNFKYMKKYIDEFIPSIRFEIPKGTYLAWVDIRGLKIGENEFLKILSSEGKLVVESGSIYGITGCGFLRISVATHLDTLIEALKRLERVINELNS
jgi:cystathionine beta-lyase